MPARDDLIAFEKQLDASVDALSVLQVPLNAVLTAAFLTIDGLFHGSRIDDQTSPRPEAGYSAASRLSYLLPYLLKCPTSLVGTTVADSMEALSKDQYQELLLLFQYGHFCEIMPEVHRGLYAVSGGGTEFALQHASESVANGESCDVVLTEMAMPFFMQARVDATHFDALASTLPVADLETLVFTVAQIYSHYQSYSYETPILSNEAFVNAAGVTYDEFVRFRSAWAAVADFSIGMADAVTRRLRASSSKGERDALGGELFEWLAPRLKSTFLGGLIVAISKLDASKFDTLMRIFSVEVQQGAHRHGGEGFFPPIFSYPDSYQFHPHILKIMLSARNVPYALNRVNRKKFDTLVSSDLEPQLLKSAESILRRMHGVEVSKNYAWGAGEIDLLAYHGADNVALHVQAKAALPPQGARMVDRVEGRSREGLKQLAAFRSLPQTKIDEIVSSVVKRPVSNVRVLDVLLCRSSVGSYKIWADLKEVAAVNLPLLNVTVDRLIAKGRGLADFGSTVNESIAEVVTAAVRGWQQACMDLAGTKLTFPVLDLDHAALNRFRMHWHPK